MDFQKVAAYIDSHKDEFIQQLKEWISYKTVSSDATCRKSIFDFIKVVKKEFEQMGYSCEIVPNPAGQEHFPDGKIVDFPPFLLAQKTKDPTKKTLCIYGHLDVQPAEKKDGWATEPFDLTIVGDAMFGRGSTDDKGPVLGWLCVLKALKSLKMDLGLNLKFVFEGFEECGGEGLMEMVKLRKETFFKDVDFICISDNYWLGTNKPCVTYGLRGLVAYQLEVCGPNRDLHSGVYGGTVHEPLTDLIHLMSKLVDHNAKILVPGISDEVAPLTEQEKQTYKNIDFDTVSYARDIGCTTEHLLSKSKETILMGRWRYPTLSLHGIEGAFSGPGGKTVIPAKVIGKFSVRTVPNMTPEHVDRCVKSYTAALIKDLHSPNKITVTMKAGGCPAWVSDFNNVNYTSAIKATRLVYGVDPDLTREGGSIPIALEFEQILGVNVMLLPMGRGDDGAHSQNEKLNISNFVKGIKLFYAYLAEMSKLT